MRSTSAIFLYTARAAQIPWHGSNQIGDEGARALSGLVNLTTLNLRGNGIGAEGARALSGLVNLTTLDLSGNGIGAEGARALSGLVNLTTLDLADNGVIDLSLFLQLQKLERARLLSMPPGTGSARALGYAVAAGK